MEKVNNIFWGMFLCIVIMTIIFILNIFMNANEDIHLKDVNDYMGKITAMREDIDNLKVTDNCRNTLYEIADTINATHFSQSHIKIKEYIAKYQSVKPLTELVALAQDNCSLKDTDAIYVLAMSSMVFPEEVKNSYNMRYEFHIRDWLSRKQLVNSHQEVGSFTTKSLELRVLKELIEVLS